MWDSDYTQKSCALRVREMAGSPMKGLQILCAGTPLPSNSGRYGWSVMALIPAEFRLGPHSPIEPSLQFMKIWQVHETYVLSRWSDGNELWHQTVFAVCICLCGRKHLVQRTDDTFLWVTTSGYQSLSLGLLHFLCSKVPCSSKTYPKIFTYGFFIWTITNMATSNFALVWGDFYSPTSFFSISVIS